MGYEGTISLEWNYSSFESENREALRYLATHLGGCLAIRLSNLMEEGLE